MNIYANPSNGHEIYKYTITEQKQERTELQV